MDSNIFLFHTNNNIQVDSENSFIYFATYCKVNDRFDKDVNFISCLTQLWIYSEKKNTKNTNMLNLNVKYVKYL